METKVCGRCGEAKVASTEQFNKSKETKDGLQTYCRSCQKQLHRQWYEKNAKRKSDYFKEYIKLNPSIQRVNKFKRDYGVSEMFIQSLMNKQMGCCAICKESLIIPESEKSFCVDHNHSTGKVRALLCARCNKLIGMANEDKEILKKAIIFLEEHNGTSDPRPV